MSKQSDEIAANTVATTRIANAADGAKSDETEVAMGAARVSVRVLMVARQVAGNDAALREAIGLEPMSRLRAHLESDGHTVSLVAPTDWHAALNAVNPDVVLIEVGDAAQEAANLCSEMRKADSFHAVLAVLPTNDEADVNTVWPALEAACIDDFVGADAPRAVVNNRVLLLARLTTAVRANKATRARLARHMQIDETTQLLNRRFFFQAAHREVSRARRYGHIISCLMVDIDYLDGMGKKFGYSCVEYVLRGVAYTVRQWTRDSDVVGRFSERKFAVLLPETDIEGAVAVREKILNAIAEGHYTWLDEELPVSVSIGEAERRYERPMPLAVLPAVENTDAATDESGDSHWDDSESEPISVREELATLLEDADAALNVARRASLRPGIFVQYTTSTPQAQPQS